MDFLLDVGINNKVVDALIKKYDESTLDLFKLEKANVVDNINYFRNIGVKRVDDLLIAHIELFTKDPKTIIDTFDKYNIEEIVLMINKDINYINFL